MGYLAPLDRIIGHFCSEGYSVSVVDGVLWLRRDGSSGAVWIVPADGGLDEILWAVMGATEYSNRFGASYVALPNQLAKKIDESHFWTYGIGLIIYDGEVVREVLRPRPRADLNKQPTTPATHDEDEQRMRGDERALDKTLLEELLRRVERIELEITRIDELELLESRLETLERRLREESSPHRDRPPMAVTPSTPQQVRVSSKAGRGRPDDQLPSYLRDNPWIEVLAAKR
ncbi:MAG: hypothetical protein QW059_02740 [Nitrososphaerota archaeon]